MTLSLKEKLAYSIAAASMLWAIGAGTHTYRAEQQVESFKPKSLIEAEATFENARARKIALEDRVESECADGSASRVSVDLECLDKYSNRIALANRRFKDAQTKYQIEEDKFYRRPEIKNLDRSINLGYISAIGGSALALLSLATRFAWGQDRRYQNYKK